MSWVNCPREPVFARELDYLAVGANGMFGVFGASLDVHLAEIADAILGVVFIDFMRDDIGNRPAPAGQSS
jgi:hypothetical protein